MLGLHLRTGWSRHASTRRPSWWMVHPQTDSLWSTALWRLQAAAIRRADLGNAKGPRLKYVKLLQQPLNCTVASSMGASATASMPGTNVTANLAENHLQGWVTSFWLAGPQCSRDELFPGSRQTVWAGLRDLLCWHQFGLQLRESVNCDKHGHRDCDQLASSEVRLALRYSRPLKHDCLASWAVMLENYSGGGDLMDLKTVWCAISGFVRRKSSQAYSISFPANVRIRRSLKFEWPFRLGLLRSQERQVAKCALIHLDSCQVKPGASDELRIKDANLARHSLPITCRYNARRSGRTHIVERSILQLWHD